MLNHLSMFRLIYSVIFLVIFLPPATTLARQLEPYLHEHGEVTINLPDLRGKMHNLRDYRGQVVLVNFWASWCPPCIIEMPGMQRLKRHLGDKGFEILAINIGEGKFKVNKFLKIIDYRETVLLDKQNQTFKAWRATVLPTSFLIDKSGKIRYRLIGGMEWDNEETIAIIESLITESPAEPVNSNSGRTDID